MAGTGKAHLVRTADTVLTVEDLVVEYRARGGKKVHAVSGVSFDIRRGETLGLVGESGCGKSTTAKSILQLVRPTSGSVCFEGRELSALSKSELRRVRRRMQIIFQDPRSSLNPRRKVLSSVREPLDVWNVATRAERLALATRMLDEVGIDAGAGGRRPRQLSGGQCQRVSLARALVLSPSLLICDEPVSSLDVSIQAQIINLLERLKGSHGLTMLFVAHNLAVVKNVSDRVAVMYLGKLCEVAPSERLYSAPAHPYSAALISAIPVPDPNLEVDPKLVLSGEVPSPINPPSGCRFRLRCPNAGPRCAEEEPQIRSLGQDQFVACHFPLHAGVAGSRASIPVSGTT